MIILVEDEKDLLDVNAQILEAMLGQSVDTAANGQIAMELIASKYQKTDTLVVLSDVNMPKMTGFELADWLNTSGLGFKMILMSGYFENLPVAKQKYPNLEFLEKPLDYPRLAELVSKLLAKETGVSA